MLHSIIMDSLALVISGVAGALATYAAIQTYTFNKASFWVANYHQFDVLLIELDKQLIEYPELYAIYDTIPFEGGAREKVRLEAFVHMHLDLFQMVHSFISDQMQRRRHIDQEFIDSWIAYMSTFIRTCHLAQEMLTENRTRSLYESSFVKKMGEFVAINSQTHGQERPGSHVI
jgi:hypothetical protein